MAVEAKVPASAKTGSGSNLNNKPEICNMDNMVVCDVDTDYTGRFAVVSSEKKSSNSMSNNKKSSFVNSNKNQFSKELKIGEDEAVDQEANDMFQVICFIFFREINFHKFGILLHTLLNDRFHEIFFCLINFVVFIFPV